MILNMLLDIPVTLENSLPIANSISVLPKSVYPLITVTYLISNG